MDKYKMLHTKYYAALFSINSYFETELDNLEKFGDHYLALQSIERSKSVATGTPAE